MPNSEVAHRHSIPESRRNQIKAFTKASQQKIYQGTIRKEMTQLGYADRPITLTDPVALENIDGFASDMADSIVRVYNAMLDRELALLPDGLSPSDVERALGPFFDEVRSYNEDTLIPYASSWSAEQARLDFYANNGIDTQWNLVPDATDSIDICLEALEKSPMATSDAIDYEFPAHRNCPHSLVPDRSTITGTLPSEDQLWAGGDVQSEEA